MPDSQKSGLILKDFAETMQEFTSFCMFCNWKELMLYLTHVIYRMAVKTYRFIQ